MSARQVADPDDLAEALSDALARNEPALLTAKVGEMPDPWPHIHLSRVRG
jgi:thiamine pyrophosphate-dependent acetolactate synthase large subunit-like protein